MPTDSDASAEEDGLQSERRVQADRQGSGAELFGGYSLPHSHLGLPFQSNRVVDVGGAAWQRYQEEGRLYAASPLERCCCRWFAPASRSLRTGWRRFAGGKDRKAGRDDEEQQREERGKHAATPAARRLRSGRRHRSIFGLPMLAPGSWAVRAWDTVISLLDLTYTAFLVPLSLAFDDMEGARFTWFNAANVAGTAFYVADMLLSFHTGFVLCCDVKRTLVTEGAAVADYYLHHGSFYTDVLASLPIVPELVLTSVPADTTSYKWFYVLRLLRLARVFALLKVWGGAVFTNAISRWLLQYISTAGLYIVNLVLALALLVNLMGCIWWFVAELEGLENSWAANVELHTSLLDASDPARWLASVYFATTTMTTVGYGDITPWTPAEQAVAIAFMAFAVFYFGFVVNFVGDLIHGASRSARLAETLRHKLEDVESWMQERHIPAGLQEKVRQYYLQVWAPHAGIDDAQYFGELPVELRGEIVRGLAGAALRRSHLFRLLDDRLRAQLATVAVPVRLVAGHNLFEEGDPADSFYVLQEGEAVALRGAHRLRPLHGPALLGPAAMFSHYVEDCSRRLHTVRAVTNCTVWEFRGAHLAKMLAHSPAALPPLCDSYLQYLQDLRLHIERRGQAVPHRISRIEQAIRKLRDQVLERLEPWKAAPGANGSAEEAATLCSTQAAEQRRADPVPTPHCSRPLDSPRGDSLLPGSPASAASDDAAEDEQLAEGSDAGSTAGKGDIARQDTLPAA